jgi:hypothetical protein
MCCSKLLFLKKSKAVGKRNSLKAMIIEKIIMAKTSGY